VFALVLVSTACQPSEQEANPLTEEDVVAIRELIEVNEQAGLAGDWESFFTHFAEDAVFMWPYMSSVEGLAAIKRVKLFRAIESKTFIKQIDGEGDLAFVRGTLILLLDYEGAVKEDVKFLYMLRKQPDGSWLFTIWITSPNRPPRE
jgi:ketosteroid isomerase-like protein